MRKHQKEELPQGHFTRNLRRLNGYTEGELREWLLEPGMKFTDTDKWWHPGTARDRPHEGLDLLIFLDGAGKRHHLPPGATIPPLLNGTEMARIPDYLGETVILAHDFLDDAGRRLHTFYAHLQPTGAPASTTGMVTTSRVGKIAVPTKKTYACPPHLHLSLAWVDKSYSIQDFRWDNFCASETFRSGDPLLLLGHPT